jgi:hypothetical protein
MELLEERLEDRQTRLTEAWSRFETRALGAPPDSPSRVALENFLAALYELTRLWRGHLLAAAAYDDLCEQYAGGRVVAGLTFARGENAHGLVHVVDSADACPEVTYDFCGAWHWQSVGQPNPAGNKIVDHYGRSVAGRDVVASGREAVTFVMEDLPRLARPLLRA